MKWIGEVGVAVVSSCITFMVLFVAWVAELHWARDRMGVGLMGFGGAAWLTALRRRRMASDPSVDLITRARRLEFLSLIIGELADELERLERVVADPATIPAQQYGALPLR